MWDKKHNCILFISGQQCEQLPRYNYYWNS